MDDRGDRNDGCGNDWSRANVAQAAAMLAGVMCFLLIGVGISLRAEGGAKDEQG